MELSARSPKYPGLYDENSGVLFELGKARVTVEQAEQLAKRRFTDGILIGEFDEEGRTVNEQPAKEWARDRNRGGDGGEPAADEPDAVKPEAAPSEPAEPPQDAPPLPPEPTEPAAEPAPDAAQEPKPRKAR